MLPASCLGDFGDRGKSSVYVTASLVLRFRLGLGGGLWSWAVFTVDLEGACFASSSVVLIFSPFLIALEGSDFPPSSPDVVSAISSSGLEGFLAPSLVVFVFGLSSGGLEGRSFSFSLVDFIWDFSLAAFEVFSLGLWLVDEVFANALDTPAFFLWTWLLVGSVLPAFADDLVTGLCPSSFADLDAGGFVAFLLGAIAVYNRLIFQQLERR